MKGIIFNAVQDAVTDLLSEDTWDDLLDAAGVDGAYTAIGTYPDEELLALVHAGVEATGHEAGDLVRLLGRHAFPHLVRRHPEFAENVDDARSFLHTIDDIIHPEVMKLHPDARPPRFDIEDLDSGGVRMTYRSDRQLGVLAEGLIEGAADWFNETATITLVSGAGESVTVYDIHLDRAS